MKLTSTDAFVVTDLPPVDGTPVPAAGVVRTGRKILQSSAKDLARSATYTMATFEQQRGGASAGINAEGDAVAEATQAFVQELEPLAAANNWFLDAGKGTDRSDLAPLLSAAAVEPLAGDPKVLVAGVVAATSAALGGLHGRTFAIEGAGLDGLTEALVAAGASEVKVPAAADKPWMIWGAEADAVLCGSKPGTLSHQGAPMVKAKAVVPWGPLAFTTKAFAMLQRENVTMVPDFISTAGGLIASFTAGDESAVLAAVSESVQGAMNEVAEHELGLFLGACLRAEAFLASWSTPPFGRPLAA